MTQSGWQARLAAISEVASVLIVGSLLARLIQRGLDLGSWKGAQSAMLAGEPVDFLLLSRLAVVELSIRYAVLCGIAFSLGWWHRRRRLGAYGLTTAATPVPRLVRDGVILFGVIGLPPMLLVMTSRYLDLGAGAPQWELFPDRLNPQFLLYAAISSFVLVPILEELFFRGYVQARLTEDFGAVGSIFLAALLFALAHGQYYRASVLSLGMLVSLAVQSLVVGFVFYRTGSLIPPIVAHSLVNLPTPRLGHELIVLVCMSIVVVIWRKTIFDWAQEFKRMLTEAEWLRELAPWLLAIALGVVAVVTFREVALPIAIAAIVATLVLEVRERRSLRTLP